MTDAPTEEHFAYSRSLAPMMWTFLSIALVEALVVHLLVALWHPCLAALLSLASLYAVVAIVRAVRSFDRLPVVLSDDALTLRCGSLRSVTVVLADVRGLRDEWSAGALRDRRVLTLSLLAYPNTVVDLARAVRVGRRTIGAIAHRLDQPQAFRAALQGHLQR